MYWSKWVTDEWIDKLEEGDDDVAGGPEGGVHDALIRIGARYGTALVEQDQRVVGDDSHDEQEHNSHQNSRLMHRISHS